MTFLGWLTIFGFAAILTALALPLGRYMAAVYTGDAGFMERILGPVERGLYKVMRVEPGKGQDWTAHAKSVIIFSLAGWLLLYVILRTQTLWNWTGLNPQHFHSGTWDVTFNTTSSFVTNTNWQPVTAMPIAPSRMCGALDVVASRPATTPSVDVIPSNDPKIACVRPAYPSNGPFQLPGGGPPGGR